MVDRSGSNTDYKSSEPLKTLVMLCYTVVYVFIFYLSKKDIIIHSFIHSFILNIYIAPLQENYSEAHTWKGCFLLR